MTDKTSMRLIAVVLAVMTIGGIAVSGVAVAQQTAGNDEVDTQQSSHLRVIHAASDAPAVNVAVDGETVAENVEAGNASDYLELEAGNHTIEVTAASDNATDAGANETEEALFEGQIYLEPRTSSTLALTAEQTQMGGVDEGTSDTPADMNETEDNETDLGADNESELGADNESELGDNESELGDNESELGDNESELGDDNETEFGDNETEDGAAEAPTTDDSQQVTSLSPVMYVDNAWEPDDDEAALSIVHLAQSADAVDVTVADNESEDNETTLGETNETELGDNESEFGADNETEDNETDLGADNESELGDNESELGDNESELGDNESELGADNESELGDNETELGADNETEDNESALGDDNATTGGAAEAPTQDAMVLADDLEFQSASDYMTVPEGEHTLEIRQASENNDGEIITTVNITVEGGNAYSALVMDNASDQMSGVNATETPTESPTTDDNETDLGADNESDLGDNESELGDDNETELGDNETELGADNETEDNESALGDDNVTTDGASEVSLNVTTVQDVTYTVNLPNENETAMNATTDDELDADDEDDAPFIAPAI